MRKFVIWLTRLLCIMATWYVVAVVMMLSGSTSRLVSYGANIGTLCLGVFICFVFLCTFIPVKYTGKNALAPPRSPVAPRESASECGQCFLGRATNRCVTHSINACPSCSLKHMGVGCEVQPLATYRATIDKLTGEAPNVKG